MSSRLHCFGRLDLHGFGCAFLRVGLYSIELHQSGGRTDRGRTDRGKTDRTGTRASFAFPACNVGSGLVAVRGAEVDVFYTAARGEERDEVRK